MRKNVRGDRHLHDAERSVQHMQKTLTSMNVHLANAISDISGISGQAIIRSILAGERNPRKLARLRDQRIRASEEEVTRSLERRRYYVWPGLEQAEILSHPPAQGIGTRKGRDSSQPRCGDQKRRLGAKPESPVRPPRAGCAQGKTLERLRVQSSTVRRFRALGRCESRSCHPRGLSCERC